MAADLVVVDRNIFELETSAIGDAKIQLTMVAGDVVYVDTNLCPRPCAVISSALGERVRAPDPAALH